MDFALSAKAEDVCGRMWDFMREHVFPAEPVYEEWRAKRGHDDHGTPPVLEELKAEARTLEGARTYGWLLAAGYGAAFLYGLFAVGQDWDFLNLNWADNILHLATALVGVAIAKMPARSASRV